MTATTPPPLVASWPQVTVTIPEPGINATVNMGGLTQRVTATGLDELRSSVRDLVATTLAGPLGRAVHTHHHRP